MTPRFLLACGLIAVGVLARIVPHPANFAPVGAIALFGGAVFEKRWAALLMPLAIMFAGDAIIGFHELMPVVYLCYLLIALVGIFLRAGRRPIAIGIASVASSTIFYLVTNFGMWRISDIFPRTLDGLIACYIAGIPYFGRTLLSDLMFAAILFSCYNWAERKLPVFETT